MKQVAANDPGAIYVLGNHYYNGAKGLLQDRAKAKDLWTLAADLGSNQAHFGLGDIYDIGGDLKKANSTTRPRQLLDTMWQDSTLDA